MKKVIIQPLDMKDKWGPKEAELLRSSGINPDHALEMVVKYGNLLSDKSVSQDDKGLHIKMDVTQWAEILSPDEISKAEAVMATFVAAENIYRLRKAQMFRELILEVIADTRPAITGTILVALMKVAYIETENEMFGPKSATDLLKKILEED